MFLFFQDTFEYSSSYWRNTKVYQPDKGLKGLTKDETKLASYWNTAFTKICVGMSYNGATNWMQFTHSGSSLNDMIADGSYRTTNAKKQKWLSLIKGAELQNGCHQKGFNIKCNGFKARLGIFANNEKDCNSCDSWIGFGLRPSTKCGKTASMTCGSALMCPASSRKRISTFGYIFVK